MKLSLRNILLGAFAVSTGLVTLLGLLAAVVGVSLTDSVAGDLSGGTFRIVDTGFWLMELQGGLFGQLDADLTALAVAIGAFCIVQCVAAVFALVLGALSMVWKGLEKPALAASIVCLALLGLYMAFGLAYAGALSNTLRRSDGVETFTRAYLPLIFAALLLVGRQLAAQALDLRQKTPEEPAAAPGVSAPPSPEPVSPSAERARAELLVRYARLYRDGVLSEEEFSAKKKQILA